MKLVPLTAAHLAEMMGWIPDAASARNWAGPKFRHPFTAATFREDIRCDQPSFSRVGDPGGLLGFGQYYSRAGRCHLARLIISPRHRGRRLGEVLVRDLCRRGCAELKAGECSLFVYAANVPAVHLYRRLGFSAGPYPNPEDAPFGLEGCDYLVASLAEIERRVGRPGSAAPWPPG